MKGRLEYNRESPTKKISRGSGKNKAGREERNQKKTKTKTDQRHSSRHDTTGNLSAPTSRRLW
jgi:hypothetical protein